MIKAQPMQKPMRQVNPGIRCGRLPIMLVALLPALISGCVGNGNSWNPWNLVKQDTGTYTNNGNDIVLTGGYQGRDAVYGGPHNQELDRAHDLYRQKKYAEAEDTFNRVSRDRNTSPYEVEEAIYYEAESLRMQGYYPAASELYTKLVDEFPSGAKKKEALRRMFDIANYWLDETREFMAKRSKDKSGPQSTDWMRTYLHLGDRTKPQVDMHGRAVELLEKIYLNDLTGQAKVGETSLFWLGNLHFYKGNYADADHYYTQLKDVFPNGKYFANALEMSIICKQLVTGGSEYDGRRLAEARKLVDLANATCPELAHGKKDFLDRQILTINLQQADKDYNIAKFYERTGHPGAAYFYYEIVRRRYPGTKYSDKATVRMGQLKTAADAEKARNNSGSSGGFMGMFGNQPNQPSRQQPPVTESPVPLTQPGQELLPQPRTQPGSEVLPTPRPSSGQGLYGAPSNTQPLLPFMRNGGQPERAPAPRAVNPTGPPF